MFISIFENKQSNIDVVADLVSSVDLHCCHGPHVLALVAAANALQCLLSHLQLQQVTFCPALL